MDRLTFVLVAVAVAVLVALPLFGREIPREEHEAAEPSLAAALEEDLRTGKISRDEYEDVLREERP